MAPHCWGQVICFSATAKQCKGCSDGKSCAIQVRDRLAELGARIDVTALFRANQAYLDKLGVPRAPVSMALKGPAELVGRPDAKFEVEADFSGLSHHARRIASSVYRAGIDMNKDAKQGVNQFADMRFRPEYMAGVQSLLISKPLFTRDDMKLAIYKVKEMSGPVLNNTCSFVLSALQALDVITTVGEGTYALK